MTCVDRLCQETIPRRQFLTAVAATGLGELVTCQPRSVAAAPAQGLTFSFGTYGSRTLSLEKSIRLVATIGYDGVEIATRPEWDAAPERMPKARRKEVHGLLLDRNLKVTAMMEHLPPSTDAQTHQNDLARLRSVMELGADLTPTTPPLIQTVLGGGTWEEKKHLFVERVGDWSELAKEMQTVVAIKPHRGGAMSRPSEAVWLIEQLKKTPWIRMVYDYSHYAFRNLSVEETVRTALPFTAHIAVKDTIKTDAGFRFVLPGASQAFDYAQLFKLFFAGGFRGDVCCEVSGMVWNTPDYDPVAAAKQCYQNLAPCFETAGVPRPVS